MKNPTQTALHTHRNHYLFSDYYLTNRLREQPEWAADVSAALADYIALWRGYQPQADNESQTEADWIRPVLTRLRHTFNVQVALVTPFGTRKPDYVLFAVEAGRQAAKAMAGPLTVHHLRDTALAVADAKAWDRDLDRAATSASSKKGLAISDNPMLQIYVYVQHSGLPWGVVTNGRLWRLVHRSRADKLEVYYEVDLPALIEQGDAGAFKFFYLFFRREAFTALPGQPSFLERVLRQSQVYNRGISDNLKDQVYEALRFLAQGFVDFPPNGIEPTPGTVREIYTHSLIVLYRLLFILYAESRALLPVTGPQRNRLYSESYSLDALKRRIARDLDQRKPVAASMANDWHDLRQLWRVIDQGNPDLEVPAYNGGLFSEPPDDFLARYRVGDMHLRRAIDLLARTADPQTKERRFVDYRDLEIRHLGSIYEGLLEYQLRRAEQPLVVRIEKGRELYEPAPAEATEIDVRPGELYLVTDKGERKATGSYYTPDYIVEYIVAQTVGPVLDELRECHANNPAALERAILRVNVLDPSMGSGHFLVEATNYIALRLVELAPPKPPGAEFESDLAYWRRRVAQACIYGVDVNPLAVELAKLSLWLTTVARGKPLSFLDHHLRHGNSLIGSRVAEVPLEGASHQSRRQRQKRQRAEAEQRAAGQLSMLDDSAFVSTMRTATGFMDNIEQLRGETLAEVEQAAGLYRQVVTEVTAKVRQLADIWTARAFGLELAAELWPPLARYLTHGGLPFAKFDQLVAETDALARQHHFFHWELEFPEVFFDEHGRLDPAAGFDAVIGNPPYVRQEELSPLKGWFETTFPEVYAGTADLFVYFFGQGLKLLRDGGRLSYISSNSWLRANYATALRQHLRTQTTVETLLDLGDNRVFTDAPDLYPAIHVVRWETPPKKEHTAQAAVFNRGEGLADFAAQVPQILTPVTIHDQPDSGWQLDDAGRSVFAKLMKQGTPLAEVVGGQMYYGIKTGLNDAFVVDDATRKLLIAEDPKSEEFLKPYLRGSDLRPWYQTEVNQWLIRIPAGWSNEGFGNNNDELFQFGGLKEKLPSLTEHLELFSERARKRYDQGDYWWELRHCDYDDAFDLPKIFWADIGKFPRFSWDETGLYVNDKGFILNPPHPFVLGILQSRVTWFGISRLCVSLGERAGIMRYQQKMQFISKLPIPDVPASEREAIGELAMQLTDLAKARYQLHRHSRHRILSDLGAAAGVDKLNQKLTAWWELDFGAFRWEVKKLFKQDIPLKERDEWEAWLLDRQAKHRQHTQEIIRLETALNARVYGLFHLTPAEIALIEDSTKYRYGEV